MDVDAILARSPEIALVDEIAHTNAPGSARPKRWQDVDVLRRAGIDVITTVNIQHINELADVVWGITGVRVQETIPYSVLANATDVQLIDLPADDLVTRLKRGKIYPPGRARQALEHFFQRGNLAALRELALRWTAAGLDEQLTGMMLQDERAAVEASDRVMVVLDEHAGWGDVLRVAWRLASTFRTDLDVLEIIPTGDGRSGPDNGRIAAHRQLAEDLGGILVTVSDTGEESGRTRAIVEALRTNHSTILVLGVTRQKGRWGRAERIAGLDTVQNVLLQLPHIDVHVTVIEE
jgi:two-component system sensor histidine kinase KdpD